MIWQQMKDRCLNPNNPYYWDYGGRGIQVSKAWSDSFDVFIADVGRRMWDDLSLDRINNNGHYEHGNVRWATKKEQSSNTRRNVFLEFNGQRMTVTQWAEHLGVKAVSLIGRLRRGWPIEKALGSPMKVYRERK